MKIGIIDTDTITTAKGRVLGRIHTDGTYHGEGDADAIGVAVRGMIADRAGSSWGELREWPSHVLAFAGITLVGSWWQCDCGQYAGTIADIPYTFSDGDGDKPARDGEVYRSDDGVWIVREGEWTPATACES